MAEKKQTRVEEARERFKWAAEAEDKQRKAILLCKQFRSGEQWDPAIKIQREGGQGVQGQAQQPPRPCLTIDRVSAPVRQVSNAVRQAHFAIEASPNGAGSDQEIADVFKGLMRAIQNGSRAEDPIDWAADGAAEGGIGWVRLYTEYCDYQMDDPAAVKDQNLCLGRIVNNLSVYCDPSAEKPTKADARYMFVTEDVPREEFEREYGKDKLTTLDEFRATGDDKKLLGKI